MEIGPVQAAFCAAVNPTTEHRAKAKATTVQYLFAIFPNLEDKAET